MHDAPGANHACDHDVARRACRGRVLPDGGGEGAACDACGLSVADALARTVRLSVDRSVVDSQRLCPDCFAEWFRRYEREMGTESSDDDGDGDGIIVD